MVSADWMADTCRRTSTAVAARPAMMNANVEAAPQAPRKKRTTKSSPSVRAAAMPKNVTPWRSSTAT
jgi:hypothetical protein